MRTVFMTAGSGKDYISLFVLKGWEVIHEGLENADLVLLTGGSDVTPLLYGSYPHFLTHSSPDRDKEEQEIYRQAMLIGIPIVGICRGAQFLCVMNGGELVQHVTNHGTYHDMQTVDNKAMNVSSSHHQMMDPAKTKHVLVGWSEQRSSCYERVSADGKDIFNLPPADVDIEVVYWPDTNTLGHQPHPEWMNITSPYQKFFFDTIEEYLGA